MEHFSFLVGIGFIIGVTLVYIFLLCCTAFRRDKKTTNHQQSELKNDN